MTHHTTRARATAGLIFAAAATAALAPIPAAAQLISPRIVNPDNNHEYALLGQTGWAHAQMNAIRLGGNLVTVNDAAEQTWVFSTFGGYNGQNRLLWTGLQDATVQGQYQWVSGQTATYRNWAPGEPNNAGAEHWVAMYYPGHSAQGRWNDWGTRSSDPIGLPFNGVVEFEPGVLPPPFVLETDTTWRAMAPVGNQEGQPINNVGLAWEAQNPGWNTSLTFDTSSWENARQVGTSIWGQDSDTPLYLRKTFFAPGPAQKVSLIATADDDVLVYVNGNLVVTDANGSATDIGPIDVTQYIVPGQNLVALKAHDSFGQTESVRLMLYGTVPEPGGMSLAAAGVVVALLRRRSRRRTAGSISSPPTSAD